jgi:hypothetical protein
MDFRVALHVLRYVGHDRFVMATVEGKHALVVPTDEEIAAELCASHPEVEAVPVAVANIEEICADHDLALVGLYGLEAPDEFSMFSVETLPLFLEEDHA